MEAGLAESASPLTSELDHFRAFLRERFSSEREAASFIGGPTGANVSLSIDEFSRALRMAGYRRPPERLFQQVGDGDSVAVASLLRGAGLPRDAPQDASADVLAMQSQAELASPVRPPFGTHQMSPYQDRRDEHELERRRTSPQAMRVQSRPAEALLEERSMQVGEAALRQLGARLEEGIARESIALQNDNADIRSSVTEALRLLAEERRERQNEIAEQSRRIKEMQHFVEERSQRLESQVRGAEAKAAESKVALQEAEKLRELSEFKVLSVVSKESRGHEATIQREQQSREGSVSELEVRWRNLLNEERQLRNKETDSLSLQISRLEDALRAERESHNTKVATLTARTDESAREIHDEVRQRQAEIQQVFAHIEELRGHLQNESRDRQEIDDMTLKRSSAVENGLELQMNRLVVAEKELVLLKQGTLELQAGSQASLGAHNDAVARIQVLLDQEARAREQTMQNLSSQMQDVEASLEQGVRALVAEERTRAEDVESHLEARLSTAVQEQQFEKARTATQSREFSQALQAAKEQMGVDAQARRQELAAASQAIDQLHEGLTEVVAARERGEVRLSEQADALSNALQDECMSRENAERKASAERSELLDRLERSTRGQEELKTVAMRRFDEERRAREDAIAEARGREESTSKAIIRLQTLLREEQEVREHALQALQHRALSCEQANMAERSEREDRDRTMAARLVEVIEEIADLRSRVRDSLQRSEDLAALKEAVMQERTERREEIAAIDTATRELQARTEQLVHAREASDRRMDGRVAEFMEQIDVESRDRASADQDTLKRIAEEHADRTASQAAERRYVDEANLKTERMLQDKLAEERMLREGSLGLLESKALELRDSVDAVRKWRAEQYNEVIFELSKVTEMCSQESIGRQQQDQILAAEVSRLHEEALEESAARKAAISGVQEEVQDVLQRAERESENWLSQEKERWRAIEELRDLTIAETSRREAAQSDLRQVINKEVLTREEAVASSARGLQKAIAQINEEWRAALRSETSIREDEQVRSEQQMSEIRNAIHEARTVIEQHEDETRQHFQAASEALAREAEARTADVDILRGAVEETRRAIEGEHVDRSHSEQSIDERFGVLDAEMRRETLKREDTERRVAKDLLDVQARVQSEQAAREDADTKLEQRMNSEVALREEACLRETKQREDADSAVLEAMRRGQSEEHALREDSFREMTSRIHQVQRDHQQENEERVKADRELAAGVARLQTLSREEEESRIEHCERISTAIERVQEDLRATGPQRDEILRRSMEYVDQARALLSKEMVARAAKVDAIEEAVREVRMRVGDEVQARDVAVRTVADAIVEERAQREDMLVRERHVAEEELQRALQVIRKAREDEERHITDRIAEVAVALSEERDLRQEAIRVERQKLVDVREEIAREQKVVEREQTKLSQSLALSVEDQARRAKEFDVALNAVTDRCEVTRAELSAESLKRETEHRNAEHRALELQNIISLEQKERRELGSSLRRALEEEASLREAALAADRRARLEARPPSALPESIRLSARPLALTSGQREASPGPDASWQAEQRSLRLSLGEIQGRLEQAEARQKSAEERTVSMLDAIMSGLTASED